MSIFKVFSVSASMTVNREQGSNINKSKSKNISYQATVPAAKFTKFCATCIAILFGSKTPVYTVAGSTFDLFSIG